MVCRRLPARAVEGDREDHATRRSRLERIQIRRVTTVLVEERLLRGGEVLQIALDRGEVCLVLRSAKLRDRHRGEDADDDHHDQELYERKAGSALGAKHKTWWTRSPSEEVQIALMKGNRSARFLNTR